MRQQTDDLAARLLVAPAAFGQPRKFRLRPRQTRFEAFQTVTSAPLVSRNGDRSAQSQTRNPRQ